MHVPQRNTVFCVGMEKCGYRLMGEGGTSHLSRYGTLCCCLFRQKILDPTKRRREDYYAYPAVFREETWPPRDARTDATGTLLTKPAMKPSVTVVEVGGDDDDEWGEEEEVVVWSNGVDTATGGYGGVSNHHSSGSSVDTAGGTGRDQGGHPRGLMIASLANLAISYNVVRCAVSAFFYFLPSGNLYRRCATAVS